MEENIKKELKQLKASYKKYKDKDDKKAKKIKNRIKKLTRKLKQIKKTHKKSTKKSYTTFKSNVNLSHKSSDNEPTIDNVIPIRNKPIHSKATLNKALLDAYIHDQYLPIQSRIGGSILDNQNISKLQDTINEIKEKYKTDIQLRREAYNNNARKRHIDISRVIAKMKVADTKELAHRLVDADPEKFRHLFGSTRNNIKKNDLIDGIFDNFDNKEIESVLFSMNIDYRPVITNQIDEEEKGDEEDEP